MTRSYNRPLYLHIAFNEGKEKESLVSMLQPILEHHLPGALIDRFDPISEKCNDSDDPNRAIVEVLEAGMVIFHIVIAYDFWNQHKKMDQVLNEIRELETALKNHGLPIASATVETLTGKKKVDQVTEKDLIPGK